MSNDSFFVCDEYNINEFVEKFTRGPQFEFSLFNVNCQSLRNKFDLFELFLNSISFNFDVICVTETWLYDNEIQYFKLENYNFTGTQSGSRGGGVGVFVRCGLGVEVVSTDLAGADVHSIKLTVDGSSSHRHLNLTAIYRQPSTDVNTFLNDLEHLLSSYTTPHIVTGDLNIDTLNSIVSEDYLNLQSIYNYTNVINVATHFSVPHKKFSCLDHILTNIFSHTTFSGIIKTDLSDHYPTFYILKSIENPHKMQCLNFGYGQTNFEKLNQKLKNIDWNYVLNCETVDLTYNNFISTLKSSIADCTETKTFVKNKNLKAYFKPWISYNLKQKVIQKNKLYRQTIKFPLNSNLKLKYKKLRNEVTYELRRSKAEYFRTSFQQCKNSSQVWNVINTKLLNKTKTSEEIPHKLIQCENSNTVLTTPKEIANGFNDYFSKIGFTLASKLPDLTVDYDAYDTSIALPNNPESFEIKLVEEADVLSTINSIDEKKAAGIDGLSTKVIKAIAESLAYPLKTIINKCIESSEIPNEMKLARVTPLYKTGDKKFCKNYRPISILPIFSKILEKLINKQILDYLEEYNLLNSFQFGFRRNLGTSNALSVFSDKVLNAFNKGQCLLGIFIDFSKAFDTVDHKILLHKLKLLNLGENTIRLIENYLKNRFQVTKIKDGISDQNLVSCGVPQGSILGPTLFLIYVNDLYKSLKFFKSSFIC